MAGGRGAISRRIAILVGGMNVEDLVKTLYHKRSALVHGGDIDVIKPELVWRAHNLLVRATCRAIDSFAWKTTGQN
ncbi:MAG TPA: hypothetical protein EYP63_06730 [Desulfotomaculum sp.]|nr:hypothetical protein [Desulfotomaculum sp.]